MPPFLAGKATPKRVNDRELTRFERQGRDKISTALNKLRRDLFRGITEDNIYLLTTRLNDPAIMGPFRDTMTALLREWALAGVRYGQEEIERDIFGTV